MNKTPLISIPPAASVEELRQILVHVLQELTQRLNTPILDARGERVINVGKPVSPHDAVNLQALRDALAGITSTSPRSERTRLPIYDAGGNVVIDANANAIFDDLTVNDQAAIGTTPSATYRLVIRQASDASTGGFRVENSDNSGAFRLYKGTSTADSVLVDQGVDTLFLKAGKVGVAASPTYVLDVVGDINTSTLYRVGGTAGIDGLQVIVTSVTPTTNTIYYKDHAGVNQTMTVVTAVSAGSTTRTFTKGLLTA